MSTTTRVSVPGKLILCGEHSVVYGRPAIVGAVGLRLTVTLETDGAPVDGVRIRVPRLGLDEVRSWTSIADYTSAARSRWLEFAERPDERPFDTVRGSDPAHLLLISLGEAAAVVPEARPPLSLAIEGDVPIGSGFGSSAAAAAGIVAGYLAHRGASTDAGTLSRLVLEVERRQHGLPSGVDHATVIRGGLIWARRREDGETEIEPLPATSPLLSHLRVYDSGPPAESTGAVVAAVRRRLGAGPADARATLDRMAAATRELRDQLVAERHDPAAVIESIRGFERCLERLGVVPAPVAEVLRRVERRGGAGKVSGAGSLSGSSAGGVLVYHPQADSIDPGMFAGRMRELPVRPGVEGLRVETSR